MKTKTREFLTNAWEWIVAGIGFIGLIGIFLCYIFGFAVFIWRTFFRC